MASMCSETQSMACRALLFLQRSPLAPSAGRAHWGQVASMCSETQHGMKSMDRAVLAKAVNLLPSVRFLHALCRSAAQCVQCSCPAWPWPRVQLCASQLLKHACSDHTALSFQPSSGLSVADAAAAHGGAGTARRAGENGCTPPRCTGMSTEEVASVVAASRKVPHVLRRSLRSIVRPASM